MKLRNLFFVAGYEMKQQSRSWVFRVFVGIAVIGIVACHMYWQGDGICRNWKMVALPCSMPLMNAYLFGVVQSLFLIVMMADVPRRLFRQGAKECLFARPVGNVEYYWGVMAGILALFLLASVVVIVISILTVNLTSLAPVSLRYYLFYLSTLTIPSWLFVGGLTLWLSYLSGSRVLAMVIPVCWLMGTIFWLPYHVHSKLDYLTSGIPNLFSDMVEHVSLSGYLLRRSAYLLLGLGFLALCVKKTRRLPNSLVGLRMNWGAGIVLVLAGLFCGVVLEYSYYRDRQVRADYRASFERNWQEKTCRVRSLAIKLEQEDEALKMQGELLLYNPGRESLDQVVLFLNPGLRVTSLTSEGNDLTYWRDNQFILIDHSLGARGSLCVEMKYEGRMDERFCDLHLVDTVYENVFRDDRFFPTGRRGAFVEKGLLLLTPASAWYPVAIPPVNPVMPIATGRDFTRFRLEVKHPLQKVIVAQGQKIEKENAVMFTCHGTLDGISLFGANCQDYTIPQDEGFGLKLSTVTLDKRVVKCFSKVKQADIVSVRKGEKGSVLESIDNYRVMDWFEPENPYLYLLEVPVSFRSDSHAGKPEAGLVEPGMVFLRERSFDMSLAGAMSRGTIKGEEHLFKVLAVFGSDIFSLTREKHNSHPLLGIGKKVNVSSFMDRDKNDNGAFSLREVQPIRIYSREYPFIGKIFDVLVTTDNMVRGAMNAMIGRTEESFPFIGRSLIDIWTGNEEVMLWSKLDDLWTRLTLAGVPTQELKQNVDSLYCYRRGEVSYDSLVQAWAVRWGVDVAGIVTEWLTMRHEQYFRVKEAVSYFDPVSKRFKMEGKVMNVGKSSGIVSIECGNFFGPVQRFVCCVEPGKAKAFTLVTDQSASCINTGLSANVPVAFFFERREPGMLTKPWELMEEWRSIPVSEFMKEENPDEMIIDDQDAGFEVKNGNLALFQKSRKAPSRLVGFCTQIEGDAKLWKRVIDADACGDAIRGYHYIGGRSGKSTATWRLNLPEAGRYRVMGKVYRIYLRPQVVVMASDQPVEMTPIDDSGIVYYYTLSFGDQKQDVEVSLDNELSGSSGWVTLGDYDFPAGEVSVTLSYKEVRKRREVAIVADAVKFIKLE